VHTVDQENVSAALTVQCIREYLQFPPFGPEHLTNSLHHLAELAAPTSQAWTPPGWRTQHDHLRRGEY
jgi:hypothetical protein